MGAKCRQSLAALGCTLSVLVTGCAYTWLEPLLKQLISKDSMIPMTPNDTSWLVSSVVFGMVVSSLPAGLIADKYGRRTVLLTVGPMCFISWVLVIMTRSIEVLYVVVRIIQGTALSIVYTVAPMYIAEISEPRIRGELSGHFQTMWYVGVLYVYLTGPFLSYNYYIIAMMLGPLLFTFFFYMMPESPYYYLMVDRQKDASKSLSWLRDTNFIEAELQSIKQSVEEDLNNNAGWKDLFKTKKDRKAFFLVQIVCIIKYLNGIPAIVAYASEFFSQSSTTDTESYGLTIALGVLLCITTFISAFVSDSFGRRKLFIFSTFASAICNMISGTYYYLSRTVVNESQYSWVPFVSVAGFCCISNIGLGPLLQTIQAEFFPSHTRGIGGGITEIVASVAIFVNLKQYQTVEDWAGVHMNFFIFGGVGLIGTLIMYLVIPETAGKSLEEIQSDMKKKIEGKNVAPADMETANTKVEQTKL